jgi:UDP-N-acetylmuramoylalanine--D-glutamate ligase
MDLTNIHFTSQLELLLKYNKKNVIGITATKGKSTTSTLTYEVIKACGKDSILLGNIGRAIFDDIEKITEDTLVVVEMSALQLEFVDCSPHIGCIINLYEDHLDHAGTVEHYHANKLNMFKYQSDDDYAIYCKDIEPLNSYISDNYKAIKYAINYSRDDSLNTTSIINNYVTLNNEHIYNKQNNHFHLQFLLFLNIHCYI